MSSKDPAEKVVRDIRRKTRRKHSTEEKIRIVLEGLRGGESIAESLDYSWSKKFLEAGKKRLAGDTARQATSNEVKALRAEARDLKEALAEQMLENRLLKKSMMGETKNEIPRIREARDHPPGRAIPSAGPTDPGQAGHSEDNLQSFGLPGLEDRTSGPGRVRNRIPDSVRQEIGELALQEPEFSPRERAGRCTDTKRYFVSETSVYRILKAHDLITSPAFVVIKAADAFRDKTTAPNQLW